MAKLSWNAIGDRSYETGVDRGVLYPKVGFGLPWNGLVTVSDRVSGGTPTPYYLDGLKYLNVSSVEEFKATIDAYSSPVGFDLWDGGIEIASGLTGMQQPRQSFGFTYRTSLGTDVDDLDYGYLIHLVYDAMAHPSSRTHESLSGTPNPIVQSWEIETTPPLVVGYRPSAHLIVDSTLTSSTALAAVEDVLYGSLELNPTLPTISELIALFS